MPIPHVDRRQWLHCRRSHPAIASCPACSTNWSLAANQRTPRICWWPCYVAATQDCNLTTLPSGWGFQPHAGLKGHDANTGANAGKTPIQRALSPAKRFQRCCERLNIHGCMVIMRTRTFAEPSLWAFAWEFSTAERPRQTRSKNSLQSLLILLSLHPCMSSNISDLMNRLNSKVLFWFAWKMPAKAVRRLGTKLSTPGNPNLWWGGEVLS